MDIPVFHDDQHGTAIITGAAVINALKVIGKNIEDVRLVTSGAGAAGMACLDLLVTLGMKKAHITVSDSKGVLHQEREDITSDANRMSYADGVSPQSLTEALVDADIFLGVPSNIASYALFTMMMAQVCGYEAGEFIHTFGDAHIYSNHVEQLELQLSRDIRPLPKMKINPTIKNIEDFTFEDFELVDYNPHPHIKGKVAI